MKYRLMKYVHFIVVVDYYYLFNNKIIIIKILIIEKEWLSIHTIPEIQWKFRALQQ